MTVLNVPLSGRVTRSCRRAVRSNVLSSVRHADCISLVLGESDINVDDNDNHKDLDLW